MGSSLSKITDNILCRGCICQANIPPTIQMETDLDYNSDAYNKFEFISFNYKGDVQYYNTEALRQLTSGILPVVVYPSISPYASKNSWPLFCYTTNGNGQKPSDLNPNIPYNGSQAPEGWTNISNLVNSTLANYNYENYGKGSLLPQSEYLQNSIIHHPSKTVSLFCAIYDKQTPNQYLVKVDLGQGLTFYVLEIQNGN